MFDITILKLMYSQFRLQFALSYLVSEHLRAWRERNRCKHMGKKLYALSVLTHTSLRRLGAIDIHRVNPGHTEHQSVSAIPHRQQGEVCSRCGWRNGIHCHLLLNSAEQHGAERSYRLPDWCCPEMKESEHLGRYKDTALGAPAREATSSHCTQSQ